MRHTFDQHVWWFSLFLNRTFFWLLNLTLLFNLDLFCRLVAKQTGATQHLFAFFFLRTSSHITIRLVMFVALSFIEILPMQILIKLIIATRVKLTHQWPHELTLRLTGAHYILRTRIWVILLSMLLIELAGFHHLIFFAIWVGQILQCLAFLLLLLHFWSGHLRWCRIKVLHAEASVIRVGQIYFLILLVFERRALKHVAAIFGVGVGRGEH